MPVEISALENRGRPTERIQQLFDQVINSETFQTAPLLRTLLLYLWQHQGEPISEYAIAVDALGRRSDFEKGDATVRVQIARLRAKLKEFYEGEGESFSLRLSVPLGGHRLLWAYSPPLTSLVSTLWGLGPRYRKALLIAASLGAVLAVLCIVLLLENRSLKASLPTPPQQPRFWQSFLAGGKPTTIVVPSPLYFHWPSLNLLVRDLTIPDFTTWPTSPIIRQIAEKWGPPTLVEAYVGGSDMMAGIGLLQYLEKQRQQADLIESRYFGADSVSFRNTIFLGIPRTTSHLKRVLEKTNFYIASVNPALVRNRNPRPGEAAEYPEVRYSTEHRLYPGLIILVPSGPQGTRSLILLGERPATLTSMLLSVEGLKLLDEQWRKGGSPEFWEIVIQAEVNGPTILKTSPASFRGIPETFGNKP